MRSRRISGLVPLLLTLGLSPLACAWASAVADSSESDASDPSLSADLESLPAFVFRFDGTMEENIRNADGGTSPISTTLQMDVSGATGALTGTLKGVGLYEQAFACRNTQNPSEIWDRATIAFTVGYTAEVNTNIDLSTGEFSAPFTPEGSLSFFELVKPFTDSRCTNLNSDPPGRVELDGAGRIFGNITPNGEAVISTDWQAGEGADVHGTWSGQGTIVN